MYHDMRSVEVNELYVSDVRAWTVRNDMVRGMLLAWCGLEIQRFSITHSSGRLKWHLYHMPLHCTDVPLKSYTVFGRADYKLMSKISSNCNQFSKPTVKTELWREILYVFYWKFDSLPTGEICQIYRKVTEFSIFSQLQLWKFGVVKKLKLGYNFTIYFTTFFTTGRLSNFQSFQCEIFWKSVKTWSSYRHELVDTGLLLGHPVLNSFTLWGHPNQLCATTSIWLCLLYDS